MENDATVGAVPEGKPMSTSDIAYLGTLLVPAVRVGIGMPSRIHVYNRDTGIKMQPESEMPINGRTDGIGCGLGVAVFLVTEDGRCGFVGREPRGGQPIPPDRRNPGPPSRAIPNRAWRYMKPISGNGRSRRNRAASHSEPEMIRLFPRQCVIHGIETSSTDSCRSADRRLASGPLRLAGWHTHGSDDIQTDSEV